MVSHNLFSLSEVQGDSEFIEYINTLDSYQTPLLAYRESESRKPSLNELYQSLKKAKIEVVSEKIKVEENITTHEFEIKDNDTDFCEDLTIKYTSNQIVESICGIKTHHRILIKLAAELSEICGSFYIINPYESYFIKKGKTYEQIWNELKSS